MASTILLSYRKTVSDAVHPTNPTMMGTNTVNNKSNIRRSSPLSVHFAPNGLLTKSSDDVISREMLSSSLSTTYASSSSASTTSSETSATTSEDEMSTARRYSDSNNSSSNNSVEGMPISLTKSDTSSSGIQSGQSSASSNAAFEVDDEDLCNNNSFKVSKQPILVTVPTPMEQSSKMNASIINKQQQQQQQQSTTSTTLDNTFVSLYVNGRRSLVILNTDQLVYEPEMINTSASTAKHAERTTIPLNHVLSVWICQCGQREESLRKNLKPKCCSCMTADPVQRHMSMPEIDPSQRQASFLVKVFHAKNSERDGYKLEMLTLACCSDVRIASGTNDESILADFAYKIRNTLEEFDRPKRLLLFVNPYGGSRKATKIFDHKIKPLFELAGVDFTLIVTERANHAKEMLINEKTDLHAFDGIVCVGGDGMFGEILNGILIRTQRQYQVNYDSIDAQLVKPTIKLGVIPAGSTDAIVYATSGNKSPINSALSILLGQQLNIDVGAVHHRDEDKLIRYTASFLGYGFMGDTMADSERNRWLGPRRYELAGIKKFLNHRLYSGEIKLCIEPSDGSPKHHNPCGINCALCDKAGHKSREILDSEDSPACISIRGRFLAINAALVSCRCGMSKNGISPMAHVGNGCSDLILVSKCSRWNYFRYLFRVAFSNKSPFDFDFVDAYRVREFEFNPIIEPHKRKGYTFEKSIDYDFFDTCEEETGTEQETSVRKHREIKQRKRGGYSFGSSVWNCDGEVLDESAIHVKVHCQLVTVFAAGFDVNKLFANKQLFRNE